jgi:hypothetical protein
MELCVCTFFFVLCIYIAENGYNHPSLSSRTVPGVRMPVRCVSHRPQSSLEIPCRIRLPRFNKMRDARTKGNALSLRSPQGGPSNASSRCLGQKNGAWSWWGMTGFGTTDIWRRQGETSPNWTEKDKHWNIRKHPFPPTADIRLSRGRWKTCSLL